MNTQTDNLIISFLRSIDISLKEINKKMTEARLADKKAKFYPWISRKEYKKQ